MRISAPCFRASTPSPPSPPPTATARLCAGLVRVWCVGPLRKRQPDARARGGNGAVEWRQELRRAQRGARMHGGAAARGQLRVLRLGGCRYLSPHHRPSDTGERVCAAWVCAGCVLGVGEGCVLGGEAGRYVCVCVSSSSHTLSLHHCPPAHYPTPRASATACPADPYHHHLPLWRRHCVRRHHPHYAMCGCLRHW